MTHNAAIFICACYEASKVVTLTASDTIAIEVLRSRLTKWEPYAWREILESQFKFPDEIQTVAQKIHQVVKTHPEFDIQIQKKTLIKFCQWLANDRQNDPDIYKVGLMNGARHYRLPRFVNVLRWMMTQIAPHVGANEPLEKCAREVLKVLEAQQIMKDEPKAKSGARHQDPELLALSKTLPRRPGYVMFVREARFLRVHEQICREQGMVVFARPDGTGEMLFPMLCAYQSLRRHRSIGDRVPRWFVPAGTGRALVRVVAMEYAATPLGDFKHKTCEPNYQIQEDLPALPNYERPIRDGFPGLNHLGDAVKDKARQNNITEALQDRLFEKIMSKIEFPFEVGDWVYVPLSRGELQVKAQIQATTCDFDPSYCVVRLEPFVLDDANGMKFTTFSCDRAFSKKLITQRAFPPIPYESKREIGTRDVPGGYLNLDWE